MIAPDIPADEATRLDALVALRLLDTPPEQRFDRITATVQRVFKAPIALIVLVDSDRLWFKSHLGLAYKQVQRECSPCQHAILGNAPFVVPEVRLDPRFAGHPLVSGEPFIRFYAGIPLHTSSGARIGTLCMMDSAPRTISPQEVAILQDLAQWAELELNVLTIEQANAISRDKEARLQAIVEHAGDAIVTVDDAGLVETFNPAAQRMFGYTPYQIIGQPVSTLVAPHHRDGFAHELEVLADEGIGAAARINRQMFCLRSDGRRFPANLVLGEMQHGERRAFTGIVRDISGRRRDATLLKKLNRRLAEALSLQQAIVNSTNYAIIAVNIKGKVTMFNHGAQRMFGYAEHEMRDQQALSVLFDPDEMARHVRALGAQTRRSVRPGPEVLIARARQRLLDESEWEFIRKDGGRLPVSLSISALWDQHDELAGYVGVMHDLSERKVVESMKNEFISTVSHELRTPLTSIRGALGLLVGGAAGEIPAPARTLLDIANTNCARLVRLVSDILDVEKIESGNVRFDPEVQPLLPLVEQAVLATRSFASQYQVSFALRADADAAQLQVAVDLDRMTQVIVNLLSNASKFAPRGDVVEVSVGRADGYARVSVVDHGAGIAPEFRDRIFQKFAQADASDSRRLGGTGLGLSISKAIVDKHDGRIGFDSECGVRTEFYVELPLAAGTPFHFPDAQG